MSVRYYDMALEKKIRGWVKDEKMQILKPNETTRLFKIKADESGDKPIELPLIALSRATSLEITNISKKPMTFDGMTLDSNEKNSIRLDAIPISIGYQIDIYTRHFDEGDEYVRNFVFNIINFPKLAVNLPYNGVNLNYNVNMRLEQTIEDNSDIPQRLISGEFTRWTIKIIIDDAYLFGISTVPNVKMCDNPTIDTIDN